MRRRSSLLHSQVIIRDCGAMSAPPQHLFEAFFWLELRSRSPTELFDHTVCLWHSPDNVSNVTSEFRFVNHIIHFCFIFVHWFLATTEPCIPVPSCLKTLSSRDIPQFCFPDMETFRIAKPETQKNDNFSFALQDSSGARVYGKCYVILEEVT